MADRTDPSPDPLAPLAQGSLAPGDWPSRPPRRRRGRGARRLVAGGVAAAVLLVGGVAVASTGSSPGPSHRTAEAGTHTVDQVLDAVATIEPVSQASVAFPVAGTVATVPVAVGDEVLLGDTLATLDEASLVVSLHEAKAALAQAELTLEQALDGEDVGGFGGSAGGAGAGELPTGASGLTSGSSSSSTSTSGSGSTRALTSDDGLVGGASKAVATTSTTTVATLPAGSAAPTAEELAAAQQAVLDAQQQVDADLAAAQAAYDAAVQVCAAVGTPVTAGGADGAVTTTTEPSDGGLAACQAALQAVLDAQAQVAASEQAVSDAATTLTDLLDRLAASAGPGTGNGNGSGSGSGTGSGSGLPSGSGTGSGSGLPSGSGSGLPSDTVGTATTSSPSAAALIAHQKAVDAAAAGVAVAEQAIDQATIASPIAGTVASVALAPGDVVTAGSSTATIVVVGSGGYEVTTTVGVADIGDVEVGQDATVAPDGTGDTLTGEVVRIGVAGTGSGSSTTYPVTIGLTGDTSGLGNGSTASVGIVTDAATEALAVPTSAVSADGDRRTVTVVDGDQTKAVTVQVGAVGLTWTEITSGLDAGQEVVLADLAEPLPSSATEPSEDDSGQTGGFPFPGGGPPAGFTPGGGGGARPGG